MEPLKILLTPKACESERTQADLHEWVDAILHASSQTAELRSRFRLREGFLEKRFMEEIWPLSLIADHCYPGRTDVFFRPVLGSQPFDAQIRDCSSANELVIPLELTQADYSQEMFHRMLYLEGHGHVPMTGSITKTGTKQKGISVRAEIEAVKHKHGRTGQFDKIHRAACRKADGDRLPATRLGIVYEGLHISTVEDFYELRRLAVRVLKPLLANYTYLYLIRSEGNHVLEVALDKAAA